MEEPRWFNLFAEADRYRALAWRYAKQLVVSEDKEYRKMLAREVGRLRELSETVEARAWATP